MIALLAFTSPTRGKVTAYRLLNDFEALSYCNLPYPCNEGYSVVELRSNKIVTAVAGVYSPCNSR